MRLNIYIVLTFLTISFNGWTQTKLSYSLNVGDTFKVYQSTTQDILQNMDGQKHEITSEIDGEFTFVVKSVTDSLIDFTFQFDRLKMVSKSNLAGDLMNVDTGKEVDENDLMGQMLSKIVNVDLQMLMYKNGKVKEVTGAEAIIDNMVSTISYLDDAGKEQVKASMAGDFSSKSLADSFEQMTYIYASKTVSKEDTWSNKFNGELSSDNIWTLKELTDNSAEIKGEGMVTFITEDDNISMNLSGTMTSDITTSLDTGFIKAMSVESTAAGNSIIKQFDGTEVPTTVVTKTTYKIDYVQ